MVGETRVGANRIDKATELLGNVNKAYQMKLLRKDLMSLDSLISSPQKLPADPAPRYQILLRNIELFSRCKLSQPFYKNGLILNARIFSPLT